MPAQGVINFQGFAIDPNDLVFSPEQLKPLASTTLVVKPIQPDEAVVNHARNKALTDGRKLVVRVSRWYKPRTTGYRSQNHRINGFVQQILVALGWDHITVEEMKYWFKHRARSRGFPAKTFPDGTFVPISEKDCNTVDAGLLIEEIEAFAAANRIKLIQYDEEGRVVRL